jgi:hypothetical protein
MIIVRDIFQLHFGKAREALEALKHLPLGDREGHMRVLTDLTGEYYTLVMESSFPSLAAWEADMQQLQDPEWRQAYSRFTPLVMSGRREIFREVEMGEAKG